MSSSMNYYDAMVQMDHECEFEDVVNMIDGVKKQLEEMAGASPDRAFSRRCWEIAGKLDHVFD